MINANGGEPFLRNGLSRSVETPAACLAAGLAILSRASSCRVRALAISSQLGRQAVTILTVVSIREAGCCEFVSRQLVPQP